MEVTFYINYFTEFGQTVAIVGDYEAFGSWNNLRARKMECIGNGSWKLDFIFPKTLESFNYRYLIQNNDWNLAESGETRNINLRELAPSVVIEDRWRASDSTEVAPHVNSSLFTDVVFGRDRKTIAAPAVSVASFKNTGDKVAVQITVHAVQIPPRSVLRVCGEAAVFGHWNTRNAPALSDAEYPFWKLTIEVPRNQLGTKYKFVHSDATFSANQWEDGSDRVLPNIKESKLLVNTSFNQGFDVRGCGVAVPVFSIRTKNGLGVGEFLDLKLMADWASAAGLKLIQILPINDTSVKGDWRDSYPYSSVSVAALHPMYLHLPAITKDAALLKEIKAKTDELNKLADVDYEKVLAYKWSVINKVWATAKKDFFTPEVKNWIAENEWVPQYALFCALKDKYQTPDFSKWGEHENITPEQIVQLTSEKSPFYDRVAINYFVQYHLHIQLKEASAYVVTKHVGLKGDIAIGVNAKSVDTWVNPHLFRLNKSTGAPPDFFSDEGQNWGFPTYNWDEMAKDDYGWWRARLRHMAQYFHAFRIDHILGFFRIWEMPASAVSGMMGRFFPSVPVWKDEIAGANVWDIKRLSEPHITRSFVGNLFHDQSDTIVNTFFNEKNNGGYEFKDKYSTEKQIAAALPVDGVDQKVAAHNAWVRKNLFKCLQNVVLIQDSEDPNRFYPRIECFKTNSYSELPDYQREVIYKLYLDYYFNRQEGLWAATALQRLPVMTNSTKMLCCGEDLGMVPKCVDPVMSKMKILGLRIQRMSDDPKKEFQIPDEYGYMTVCTPSVHDSSTLRAWWEEDAPTTQRFYNQVLGLYGQAPQHADEFISSRIITQHLYSKSMWTVFPIQDLFGLNAKYFAGRDPNLERINIPAIAEHYWKYRMHVGFEELIGDVQFQGQILQLLKETRRA